MEAIVGSMAKVTLTKESRGREEACRGRERGNEGEELWEGAAIDAQGRSAMHEPAFPLESRPPAYGWVYISTAIPSIVASQLTFAGALTQLALRKGYHKGLKDEGRVAKRTPWSYPCVGRRQ